MFSQGWALFEEFKQKSTERIKTKHAQIRADMYMLKTRAALCQHQAALVTLMVTFELIKFKHNYLLDLENH
jgi:hypothetical protein